MGLCCWIEWFQKNPIVGAAAIVAFILLFISMCLNKPHVKRFSPTKPETVLLTGGVQGLGKLLTQEFMKKIARGSLNIVIVDIRDDLYPQLVKDVTKIVGSEDVVKKHIFFYKANLASQEETEQMWFNVLKKHGPVHILINNAARVIGKRVDEMSIEQFKLTMDINFNSYVHLTMLFLD